MLSWLEVTDAMGVDDSGPCEACGGTTCVCRVVSILCQTCSVTVPDVLLSEDADRELLALWLDGHDGHKIHVAAQVFN